MVTRKLPQPPDHDQASAYAPQHGGGLLTLGTIYPCAVAGVSLTSAPAPDQRGWGPACDTSKLGLVTLSSGVHFQQRVELVELTTLMMNADIRDGYIYRQADTGAYNCRVIAGTNIESWHAWPVAIDKNWTTNPQHSPLITDYPVWLLQRWNRYGWRWGGNYNPPTVPDAMHHEFMGTPAQAVAATNLARSELGGNTPPPPPPPGDTGPVLPAWPLPAGNFYGPTATSVQHNGSLSADRPTIKVIQQRLIYKGCVGGVAASSWSTSTWADGYYGSNTGNAMNTWHSRFYPGQPYPTQCWSDDYAKLGA